MIKHRGHKNRKGNDLRWKAPILKTIWPFDHVTKGKSFDHFTNWKCYVSSITRLMVSKFARGTTYEKSFSTQTLIDFFSIFISFLRSWSQMVYCYIAYREYDLRKVINIVIQILFSLAIKIYNMMRLRVATDKTMIK